MSINESKKFGGRRVPRRASTQMVVGLQPYAGKARTHSRRQIKRIVASIECFGFVDPVLIDAIHALGIDQITRPSSH